MSPPTRAAGMTSCIRFMQRRKVDFPQPEGPIRAVTLFGFISRFMFRMASFLPYQAEISSARTVAPMGSIVLLRLAGSDPRRQSQGQQPGGQVQDDNDREKDKRTGPRLAVKRLGW